MQPATSRVLASCLSGSSVSVLLWFSDLVSLRELRFAGASDTEVQRRVMEIATAPVAVLELKLLVVHAAVGLVLGGLAYASWRLTPWKSTSPRKLASIGAGSAFIVHLLALLAMVGRYPQLYADRWWRGGSSLAGIQRIVTHTLGPPLFDFLLLIFCGALVMGALVFLLGKVPRKWLRLRKRYAYAIALAVMLLVTVHVIRPRSFPDTGSSNVLIIALDSLRTDRLGSPEVMPFASSLIPEGAFFRYAFTPIARTYPSWVSTLTGTEPRRHRVRHMFPSSEVRRGLDPTLFTILRDEGYRTFAVSDFAGDVLQGFDGGFETVDTPTLTVLTLAQSSVLGAHDWALPFLRLRIVRKFFPIWRNLPNLADPNWLVEEALEHVRESPDRPFAGLIFFSTAHFPYAAPYPEYARGAQEYDGPYLYHVPPDQAGVRLGPRDQAQVRHLYDAALRSVDTAIARLWNELSSSTLLDHTVVVITGDHGEELYEDPGIAGHGDTIGSTRSQAVPILLVGPQVPAGRISNAQVRLHDLPATILELVATGWPRPQFGDGTSLFLADVERPICVETGIWFWPSLPSGLSGKRLDYPGIGELLEMDPETYEMVLKEEMEDIVETAKERGVILGRRLWRERLTPEGLDRALVHLAGIDPMEEEIDLRELFENRCVGGDPHLFRFHEAVVYQQQGAQGADSLVDANPSCPTLPSQPADSSE